MRIENSHLVVRPRLFHCVVGVEGTAVERQLRPVLVWQRQQRMVLQRRVFVVAMRYLMVSRIMVRIYKSKIEKGKWKIIIASLTHI